MPEPYEKTLNRRSRQTLLNSLPNEFRDHVKVFRKNVMRAESARLNGELTDPQFNNYFKLMHVIMDDGPHRSDHPESE